MYLTDNDELAQVAIALIIKRHRIIDIIYKYIHITQWNTQRGTNGLKPSFPLAIFFIIDCFLIFTFDLI